MAKRQKKPILLAFGRKLRTLRLEAKLSQEALADVAGLDRTYIGGVERGERNISLVNLERLSVALGIPVEGLLKGVTK